MNRPIIILVVLIPVYRDPPSNGAFRAAPVVRDTTGETVSETTNVVPFRKAAA